MANVKVKLNLKFFDNTRNSQAAQSLCLSSANRVKSKCSGGTYEADVQAGKKRCHALVKTADIRAAKKNAKYNILAKALNG